MNEDIVRKRTMKEEEFAYELKNNSAVFKKYSKIVQRFKDNSKFLKVHMPEEFLNMAEELEYLEKVGDVYEEFYGLNN